MTAPSDDHEAQSDTAPIQATASPGRFTISSRISYLLIGGVALGGIVLMCLTVLILVLLQQD